MRGRGRVLLPPHVQRCISHVFEADRLARWLTRADADDMKRFETICRQLAPLVGPDSEVGSCFEIRRGAKAGDERDKGKRSRGRSKRSQSKRSKSKKCKSKRSKGQEINSFAVDLDNVLPSVLK